MQNLWPELNNEQSSPDTPGQMQEPLKRRRLTEPVLLAALRDWLLHDYLVPYCRILSATRIYRRCYWIDALGSVKSRAHTQTETPSTSHGDELQDHPAKGRKQDTAQAIPATLQPLVSLAGTLAQEGRPITLHGIVLEAGSSKRKETRPAQGEQGENHHTTASAKLASTLPKESGIVRASWLEAAPTVLDLLGQSPAVFLLNPFGHTLFTYDDLAPLYQRTAPTELCLFIPHKQVLAHLVAARGLTTLTALLRSDRWKTLPTNDEERERTIDGVIDLLIASMQRHFLAVQRFAFPVQVRPAVVETAPYTLIFATRRQDSLASMNDALCLYRRRLHEQSRQGVLAEAWFAAQQQERLEEEMQQLYQRVLQQGRVQRVRRWPDLRQHMLNADFGHHTVREYDEVMQQLLASGAVRCEWRQKPATDVRDEAIPGNDDMLLWK